MNEYELIFNSRNCTEIDLYVSKYPSIPLLTEEIEKIPVEGRNGDLIVKKGTYQDRSISVKFRLLDMNNYWGKLDLVYEWLTDITDNRLLYDRQDRCFRVKNVTFGDINKQLQVYGEFDVEFTVEPFMEDLNEMRVNISSSNFTAVCQGNRGAETLFIVNGQGNIQITVNDVTMSINNVNGYVEIDSKLLQVRNADGTSKDNDAIGDFARMVPGTNNISYIGNISNIELIFTNQYR